MCSYFNIYNTINNYNLYTGSVKFNTNELNKSTIFFDLIFKFFYGNYNTRDFNIIISNFYEVLGRLFFLEKALLFCNLQVQHEFFSLLSNYNDIYNLDNTHSYNSFQRFVLN